MYAVDRRKFLQILAAGAGLLAAGPELLWERRKLISIPRTVRLPMIRQWHVLAEVAPGDETLPYGDLERRYLLPMRAALAAQVAHEAARYHRTPEFVRLELPKMVDFARELRTRDLPSVRELKFYDVHEDRTYLRADVQIKI